MGLGHVGFGLLCAPPGGLLGGRGGFVGGADLFEVGGGDDAGFPVGLGPGQVGLGLGQVGGGRDQVGLGGLEVGLHGVGIGPGAAGVDLHEELAPGDPVPFLDGQAGDLAHDVGGDVGLGDGLDLAVGADLGGEVLPSHRGHLDPEALVLHRCDAHATDQEDRQGSEPNPQFFALHSKGLPERARDL